MTTRYIEKIQNNQEDIEALQRDLVTLESWSEQWLPSFNTKLILCCENEKDLGVWLSKDFKWSKQCNTAANKAMSVLGNK